ncbi:MULTISPECIES: helix-turn-helix domain-containing protein [Chryseobacterium]|uniref:AraC family transcriptional activator of pobA n=1 Tax=Chryseobacterium camelliae TaxID=1265445 RepID=A0ABU0TF29_9FLAO|nr:MULTISPECIES: AraC family transcriptional regulator [Chryseobacterium]MDT3406633.1 AraC family transcriptional activator of pobA [Pseudacidovorax intermedius]MDQ1095571.1 AraC family transcriptional activator of pobA [Chryseobacterium camelliae]MDQ1099507.1 AraC family transcriptional activator of pobA [Chryseobacterium sp. SORGH_AS_1048]MDR6086854.1 AraC family transcriptional activator of pobA [Chryseobacterium sp. SORGH_AS_0909]MDR6131225.1 AraC family transcriptional activator of pobA [
METTETLKGFYERNTFYRLPEGCTAPGLGHFNVFARDNCSSATPYSRRDYYKISLIIGKGTIHYADKWIYLDRPAVLFSNPMIPYSWEAENEDQKGFFCLFTDHFLHNGSRFGSLSDSWLFKIGGTPVFFVDEKQQQEVGELFGKMMAEIQSDYPHKYDLLRAYLHLLIHETMKMHPTENFQPYQNSSQRIASLFMELLERQFPIDSPERYLRLKTPNDYAASLSIHVNSLNRSVKEITGRTTGQQIASRVIQEAHALLKHTDWNISEIAYALGFEEPSYFTNYFKKQAGITPNAVRNTLV